MRIRSVRDRYMNRITNITKSNQVGKVNRIEKAKPIENHSSDNFLLSYEHYDRALRDLKRSFQRFFSDKDRSIYLNLENRLQLAKEIHTLVEKYNDVITPLTMIDRINRTTYVQSFHHLFQSFQTSFNKIGITENDDYTLSFHEETFTLFLKEADEDAFLFIRQFKLRLIQEYRNIFLDLAEIDPSSVKGLFIEEKR